MNSKSEKTDVENYLQMENEKLHEIIEIYDDVLKYFLRFISNIQPDDKKDDGAIKSNILKQTEKLVDDLSYLDAELSYHKRGDELNYEDMNKMEPIFEYTDNVDMDRIVNKTIQFGLKFNNEEIHTFKEKASIFKYDEGKDNSLYYSVYLNHNDGTNTVDCIKVRNDNYLDIKEALNGIERPEYAIAGLSFEPYNDEPVDSTRIHPNDTVYIIWKKNNIKPEPQLIQTTIEKNHQNTCTIEYDDTKLQLLNQDKIVIKNGETVFLESGDHYELIMKAPNNNKHVLFQGIEITSSKKVVFGFQDEAEYFALFVIADASNEKLMEQGFLATKTIKLRCSASLPRDFGKYKNGIWYQEELSQGTKFTLRYDKKIDEYNIKFIFGNDSKTFTVNDPNKILDYKPDGFCNKSIDSIQIFEKWSAPQKTGLHEITYIATCSECHSIKEAIYRIIKLGYAYNLQTIKKYIRFSKSANVDLKLINKNVEELIMEGRLVRDRFMLMIKSQ